MEPPVCLLSAFARSHGDYFASDSQVFASQVVAPLEDFFLLAMVIAYWVSNRLSLETLLVGKEIALYSQILAPCSPVFSCLVEVLACPELQDRDYTLEEGGGGQVDFVIGACEVILTCNYTFCAIF